MHPTIYPPQRTPAVPFSKISGELPAGKVPDDIDIEEVTVLGLDLINNVEKNGNLSSTAIWRDLLALTGTFRTLYSSQKIKSAWLELSETYKRSHCRQTDRPARKMQSPNECSSWYDIDFDFSTEIEGLRGQGSGTVSITVDGEGAWLIWMIRTWLENFEGRGHPDDIQARSDDERAPAALSMYDVVIVGGGQSGLSIAGRLQALGVTYLLLEKHPSIGDNWRTRYDSLAWHTVKEYGELPFGRTFDEADPYFVPTKRIGAAFEAWAVKQGLNMHTHAEVMNTAWDDITRTWTVDVKENEQMVQYKTKNVVIAIGGISVDPSYPTWATPSVIAASGFRGTILHGSQYHRCDPSWRGQRGVVVGTANTAHDVAEDMLNAGMHTTMLQRSPTFVCPMEFMNHGLGLTYNREIPTERGDRLADTLPIKIGREIVNQALHGAIAANSERFDALEKVGFKLDRYGDLYTNLYVRAGGHYADIGTSAKIAQGKIKIRTATVKKLIPTGIECEDGSILDADKIVLCTGFKHDFRETARKILGDVADVMDDFPGVDKEGELLSVAKFAGHRHVGCQDFLLCKSKQIFLDQSYQSIAQCDGWDISDKPKNTMSKYGDWSMVVLNSSKLHDRMPRSYNHRVLRFDGASW